MVWAYVPSVATGGEDDDDDSKFDLVTQIRLMFLEVQA